MVCVAELSARELNDAAGGVWDRAGRGLTSGVYPSRAFSPCLDASSRTLARLT